MELGKVAVILKQLGPDGVHAIAFSDDLDVIRYAARAMARDYRANMAAFGTPQRAIDEARVRVLEEIAGADPTDEAEGEPIAKPVWWDALSTPAREEVQ